MRNTFISEMQVFSVLPRLASLLTLWPLTSQVFPTLPILSLSHAQSTLPDEDFCYDPNEPCGAPNWQGTCATGKRQSPIDISPATKNPLQKFSFFHFNSAYSIPLSQFFARNTGETFQVQLVNGSSPTSSLLAGTNLEGKYKFAQLHFHWGSEHTRQGVRYPLELHVVHYSTKYASFLEAFEATEDQAALSVFGVLFKVGAHNPALESIILAARQSFHETPAFSVYNGPVNVAALLPRKLEHVRYFGSVSFPPCAENVVWTVFTQPVELSLEQLEIFQSLMDDQDELYTNFRPIQPLNGRRLRRYFGLDVTLSGQKVVPISMFHVLKRLWAQLVSWIRARALRYATSMVRNFHALSLKS